MILLPEDCYSFALEMVTGAYKYLTEENIFSLNKLQDQNIIYYSELKNWNTKNAFRSFSLKYVVEGSIKYSTNHREYQLSPGKILLASKQSNVHAFFEVSGLVKSMCIDISTNTINEIFSFLSVKNDKHFEEFSSGFFKEFGFVERVQELDAFKGSNVVRSIINQVQHCKQKAAFSGETFYSLAESIITDQYRSYLNNLNLPYLKLATRNEISKRLCMAKEYMDDCFLHIRSNSEIAKSCFLSEYHFIRSFTHLYKISPYQYLLSKKLEYAKDLILKNDLPVKTIAQTTGFADLATFSKAFKRKYAIPPSLFRLSQS